MSAPRSKRAKEKRLPPKNKGKRQKFDWSFTMQHNGKTVYVDGSRMGASGEANVRAAYNDDNYGRAEIGLMANTVKRVKENGVTVFDRNTASDNDDIPSEYDKNRGDTTSERILTFLVTKVVPHFADQFEECFDRYYDEEAMKDFNIGNGAAGPTSDLPTPEERIESLGA